MFVVFFQKPNKFSFTIHGGKANFQILLAEHSVCTVHITEGASLTKVRKEPTLLRNIFFSQKPKDFGLIFALIGWNKDEF